MDKALEMGRTSATGSFKLLLGVSASTIIMAIGTIIIARLLSPSEYGLYSVVLIPALMIGLFRDFGVNSAVTKYVAQLRAANARENTYDIVAAGLTFEIATGMTLSLLSLVLASFIASAIFHRPESTLLISIVSISIFSGALVTIAQSSFIGFERMGLSSLTMIFQATAKTGISILLVFLGFGALGAVVGYALSFLASGIVGLAILYAVVFRSVRNKGKKFALFANLRTMLRYGIPLSVSDILTSFLVQFNGFMIAFFCSDVLIGNYQITVNFAVLLTFFTTPIATVLFPTFAKLNPQNEHQLLGRIFASSVKYTSLLLLPATMAMMVLSKPIISTVFGDKWVSAPLFLTLYVISNLLAPFGSVSMNGFLAGLGETKTLMKQKVLTLVLGIPLSFLLIPTFGILGAIIGTFLAGLPGIFWGLYWIWKHYRAKADLKSSTRIVMASVIAATITYVFMHYVAAAEWMRLIAGIAILFAVYILVTPLIGAASKDDIDNLGEMLSGLGIISKIINIPLKLARRIAESTREGKADAY